MVLKHGDEHPSHGATRALVGGLEAAGADRLPQAFGLAEWRTAMRVSGLAWVVSLGLLVGPASATCPAIPGDVAPGRLDSSALPLTWIPGGNGVVSIADIVVLQRVALGLQSIAWDASLAASCAATAGDVSPSLLDLTTTPPTCVATGDGVVNGADVAQAVLNALNGCVPTPLPDEGLTDEQLAVLDELPPGPAHLDGIVLPGGQQLADYAAEHGLPVPPPGAAPVVQPASAWPLGAAVTPPSVCTTQPLDPVACRDALVASMILQAETYARRSLWSFGMEGDDGPAQAGLAYSFGQKNPQIRAVPPCGLGDLCPGQDPPGTCAERIRGLDCSGFLYRCALAAGLPIPTGRAATQAEAETWNRIIPQSWPVRMERVVGGPHQTGDIIGWAGHVGLVEAVAGGPEYVLQSNGRAGPETEECVKNRGLRRGPNKFTLAGMTSSAAWGAPTSVLRLRPVSCTGSPNVCIEGHVVHCFNPVCFGTDRVCVNCFNVPIEPGGCYYVEGAHQPLAGVVVSTSLDAQTTTTDAEGHFLLETDTPVTEVLSNQPYIILIDGQGGAPYGWGAHPTGQLFTVGDWPACPTP